MSLEQKAEVQQIITTDVHMQSVFFWQSRAVILSQIVNYRLCQPRPEERRYHSDCIKELAQKFQIDRWKEFVCKDQLYEMSLTGHLIKAIKYEKGSATLQGLINITEPFLPYLRRLNGKNFTGGTVRTVKGCLSAVVFHRNEDRNWTVDDNKVDEFIQQANDKLSMYFEKIKRNFPKFEEIKLTGKKQKKRQKQEQIDTRTIFKQFLGMPSPQPSPLYEDDADPSWFQGVNATIQRNLGLIMKGEDIEDRFLGTLIAFKHMRGILSQLNECQRLMD